MLAEVGVEALAGLLDGRRAVVLTGAGCSTESGIPDYRGPETRRRARNPIRFHEFIREPHTRRRYWARSTIGWARMEGATPNAAHLALADLEESGALAGIITQNVDRLHHKAGSQRVVELHGALAEVRCLACEATFGRSVLQRRLLALNPGWAERGGAELAPDGDADLDRAAVEGFRTVDCAACGGTLKPNVVFFGENVPRPVYQAALGLMEEAEALLVVGSSLAVYSGYRFVLQAAEAGLPIGFVNLGLPHRGLELASVHVDGRAGQVLSDLLVAMGISAPDAGARRPTAPA